MGMVPLTQNRVKALARNRNCDASVSMAYLPRTGARTPGSIGSRTEKSATISLLRATWNRGYVGGHAATARPPTSAAGTPPWRPTASVGRGLDRARVHEDQVLGHLVVANARPGH